MLVLGSAMVVLLALKELKAFLCDCLSGCLLAVVETRSLDDDTTLSRPTGSTIKHNSAGLVDFLDKYVRY